MSASNEIRDLNKIYMEAVYGQSAGQKLAKREKDDDAAGAPRKATPASGTGKYYKEGKPTDQQLAQRKKREKIKQLTNQGKHKEASALHNEDAKYGYDKDGNSLNPVDIEKRKKKEDDLAGSPKNEELQQIRALVEKEVKVKDTRRVVDAIRAYDKSKDASRDATYDTDEGDKEKAEIEKKYAAKERGEIDKDDPNWKKRKYHTGIHGEEVEALKRLVESGKFSDEEIEAMAWDVYEGLVKPAGTSDAAVDKATRKAATRRFGNTTPPKAKIPEGYQRNPEKGEEEERKAEKRRKESGRMPPRGDKRREDFEKWYAANVR